MAEKFEGVREFAKRMGVHHSTVQYAVKVGRVPTDENGRIPVVRGMKAWKSRTIPRSAKPRDPERQKANSQIADSIIRSRAAREAIRAKREDMDLKVAMGELIPRAEMVEQAFVAARRARDQLMAIPARIAPILAGLTDPIEVMAELEQEIERVCEELSVSGSEP